MNEYNHLPSTEELEKLANQFFKNAPFHQPGSLNDASDVLTPTGENKINTQIHHPEAFDLADPQTSLPDPQFYNGQIPKSLAGSGTSPFLDAKAYNVDHQSVWHLPFVDDQPFAKQLKAVLHETETFRSIPQLPINTIAGFSKPNFYFLGGAIQQPKNISQVNPPFDINRVKSDFPILKERVNGKPIVWLDNAATTQKPKLVIDRISEFYQHENSNIHRAAHELAARATDAYENARKKVQQFLNAKSPNEIIFVRGTTEGINLIAQTWGDQHLQPGDEIVLSNLEHHANIVPWQILSQKKGFKIKVIPVDETGQVILEEYGKLLNHKTKLVSFTHVSNALGTITPAKAIIDMAHASGARVLLDGAQSVSHMPIDLQYLNPDFFVFSGHKVFGPTGIGAVYGKEELLNQLPPWQGGGNMIKDVTFEHTEYHNAPGRFEAGTGNIADAVGLGAAIDYVTAIGMNLISAYEHNLLHYATSLLKDVPGIRQIGTAADKASVLSFTLNGYSNDEVGQALNKEGIAVRTGHHCAQPILRRFGVESTVRPSLAFYNTCSDVDRLITVLYNLANNRRKM
jgi:cysteine desulfurase/selenocysteine lyase